MRGRTVVVTGANSGIGFEAAAALAGMGARTVITTRTREKGESAARQIAARHAEADVTPMELELGRLSHVRRFASELLERVDSIHVLINNAGVMHTTRAVTEDGFEETFQVNHLAPFLLTHLLLERLRASAPARIVNVASMTHRSVELDFEDLQSERGFRGVRAYGKSKLALVMSTLELARRLDGTGVTANVWDPGGARTNVTRRRRLIGPGMKIAYLVLPSAAKATRDLVRLASDPDLEDRTGEYWLRGRVVAPSRAAMDDEAARRLWDVSAHLVGL